MILARTGLAVAGGALFFAIHPPFDVGWLGPVAIVPLVALGRLVAGDARPWRSGLLWGWLAGLIGFGLLLSWILRFGVLPLMLLVGIEAAFIAVYVAVLGVWGNRPGRALAAVVWWVALEAVRSSWPLGGFPWGVLGYSQHAGTLLPLARVLGVLGLSAILALTAVAAEALLHAIITRRLRPVLVAGPAAVAIGIIAALILVPDSPEPQARTLDVAGVQGNDLELPASVDRLNRVRIDQVVERMVVATSALASDPPDVAVWPENSLDADFRTDPQLAEQVETALGYLDGGTLLAGALLDGDAPEELHNVIAVLDGGGDITDLHLKRHLVPFGEYVPLRSWLSWYSPIEQIPRDQISGDEPTVFEVAGARIAPVNCFESIFPNLVHDQVRAGADVIVLLTNNASFGRTAAPYQHLAFSQLRAVETGRWILHAGISGVSAVVSPTGEVSQETELYEQAIVRADLPLVNGLTLATRFADAVGPIAVALALLSLVWLGARSRRQRGSQNPSLPVEHAPDPPEHVKT